MSRRHRDLPEFVRVRGGAYFFLPGVAALRYLARSLNQLPPGPRRGEPMNTLQSWLATLAVAVDDRRRWDRWPTPLALALILGIRAAMREHNLYDTEDGTVAAQARPRAGTPRARGAHRRRGLQRSVVPGDGHGRHPLRPQRAAAVHRARRGDRLMTPNPRLVSTRSCWPADP